MLSYHTCPLAILGGKDTGGMNVYVRELTRQLGRMDIQVDVFTRSQDEHVPHIVHDLGYGNRVVHVPAGPELPLPRFELAQHLGQYIDTIKRFAKRKSLQYDLIHSHYWLSGLAAKELKAEWNIPVAHMFHTLGLMKNRVARMGEEEGEYRIRGERKVIRAADRIVAATKAELAQLQWLYEVSSRQVRVIPPGVDLSRFYPIPKDEAREYVEMGQDERMLLFVGRIEALKGIDTLIEAVARMRDAGVTKRHKVCLYIIGGDAGDGERGEMGKLQALADTMNLTDMVSFLGKRSQDVLPYYYGAADVVVLPSHYESFGMVALEAMACGTPVVASRVGGLIYLVKDGETGFHVPDQDAEALAEKITTLLDDPVLYGRMSNAAAAHARNYGWERVTYQVVELYKELSSGQEGDYK
jgi:D-inositol-3-phosphate glycosyltransferase